MSTEVDYTVGVTGQTTLVSGVAAENEIIKAEDVTYGFDAGLSNLAVALRLFAGAGNSSENFIVGGEVTATGGMAVSIAPIFACLASTNQCVASTASTTVTIADADSSGVRVDVISVRPLGEGEQEETRVFNDPISGSKDYDSIDVRKKITLDVLVTQGTAGSTSANSAPSNYIKIAEVYVAAGATEITDEAIYNVTATAADEENEDWTADKSATYSVSTQATSFAAFLEEHDADGSHGDKVIKASNINFGVGSNAVKASVIPMGKVETVRSTEYAATAPVTALIEELIEHADALYPYANDLLSRYSVASVTARVATTANITSLSSLTTVDGVTLADGNIVLVKDQSDATENGLYTVSSSGEWSRHTSFASGTTNFEGVIVLVTSGTENSGKGFYINDSATIGTDELVFSEITLVASRLSVSDVGSSVKPVYFADGVPVAASTTVGGTTQPVYVASGTISAMTGPLAVAYGGTGATSLSDVTVGSASSATTSTKLSTSAGSATVPVYFSSSGVPVACSSLSLSTTGNATTATTLATARTIQTNLASTSAVSFNGSANIQPGVTGTLPVAYGGTGNTTGAATTLGTADVGDSSTPIYLSAGSPKACSGITTDSGASLHTSVGAFNVPVYFNSSGYAVAGLGSVSTSTFVGISAGASNTGTYNTGVGTYALYSNTTGYYNTGVGSSALQNNTTGYYNTAVGLNAGYYQKNIDDDEDTGYRAMYINTTGYYNTGVGSYALYSNTTGYCALYTANSSTTSGYGSYNTALGTYSLYSNTTGYSNTGVGYYALYTNTTGYYNTGVGYSALYTNTTGYYNTGVGSSALRNNTTGYYNTGVGSCALYTNTTGYYNTGVGYCALRNNTTGTSNTGVGYYALYNITSGSYNIAIGYTPTTSGSVSYTTVPDGTASYQYAIGPLKGRHFPAGSTLGELYTWLYAYIPTSGDRAGAIGTYYNGSTSYQVNGVYNNSGTLTVYYGSSPSATSTIEASSGSSTYIGSSSSSVLTLFIVVCAY